MRTTLAVFFVAILIAACAQPRAPQPPTAEPPAIAERKILYNGTIALVVPDLAAAEPKLLELVSRQGGFVAGSDVAGQLGARRVESWKLRVPVAKFRETLDAVSALGEVASVHSDSQDVTAEFSDDEARLSAKQTEEKRLLRLLDSSTGKLTDVLAVEKELSRVRGEIEEVTGRVKLLGSLAALSSITVTMTELRAFLPSSAPPFLTRIAKLAATPAAK